MGLSRPLSRGLAPSVRENPVNKAIAIHACASDGAKYVLF